MLHAADRKVILELKWLHQFQFAGFYMAREKGYYAEAGLDVTIHDGFKKDINAVVNGKTGLFSATRFIRDVLHSPIPIIALTANAMHNDVRHYLEAGMNAHIAKPVDTPYLYHTLAKFLSKGPQ